MGENDWKRARSREQVEHRANEVLDAAARLFRNMPYDEVTLQKIAKEANFTRSNLYRYFATKEEIFLTLYLSDVREWVGEAQEAITGKLTPEEFADVSTEILFRHPRLLDLTPLLALTLERNASEELYRETKIALGGILEELTIAMRTALPSLTPERAVDFFHFYQSLISGAWPMARQSKACMRILNELGMEWMAVDFRKLVSGSVLAYLKGILE